MKGEAWLLRPSNEPAANLAATIVDRLDLEPPLDIHAIVRSRADVYAEAWPYKTCDAIVVGLAGPGRPTIFLRADLVRRRERFTLAHEFGHVVMGWHIGIVACMPSEGQFEVEPLQPVGRANDLLSSWRLNEQEAEATRFASYLLLPDRFLRPLVASGDLSAVLTGMDSADVSAWAALIRLRLMLQPGFCFLVPHKGRLHPFLSPGTSLPKGTRSLIGWNLRKMERCSIDFGEATLADTRVRWYRLIDMRSAEPVDDPRTTTQLARSAIATYEADPDRAEKMFQSINGVAAGSLSADRADTVEQVLAILRHKFADESRFGAVVDHPDFDLYLRRKSEEWIRRKGRG